MSPCHILKCSNSIYLCNPIFQPLNSIRSKFEISKVNIIRCYVALRQDKIINSFTKPFYLQSIFRIPVLYPVITVQRKTTILIWNHVLGSNLQNLGLWQKLNTFLHSNYKFTPKIVSAVFSCQIRIKEWT